METMPLVILDTETTGLDPTDAIVELAIIDGNSGDTLLHSLVNPWPHKSWPVAQQFHNITPEMVRRAPLIHDLWPAIFKIIQGAHVLIYNASYDIQFFPNGDLTHAGRVTCVMNRFGELEGTPSHRGGYKWWKLVDAARIAGHDWAGTRAHRAIGDCLATKSVWEWCERKRAESAQKEAAYQATVN